MYGREYANWTQAADASARGRGAETLLRLARETQRSLEVDLAEAAAARKAASAALRNLAADGDAQENRRRALRRLLGSLERSEASIREKLTETKREAGKPEASIGRGGAALA